nr:MAG TPA: hypothetical protein [Caudoviricetes sp.]
MNFYIFNFNHYKSSLKFIYLKVSIDIKIL